MLILAAVGETLSLIQFILNYWWLLLILAVVVVILLWTLIKWGVKKLFKGLWLCIKYLFIGLFYIIASPVFLIIGIVKLIRFMNNDERHRRRKKKKE